jgi:hypothetical protein
MKYATALATTLFFAATSAHAATITIGYELPSFSPGTITTVGQIVDPVNGTLNVNGFGINTWSTNATGWAPTTTHLVGNVSALVGNPFVMNSFSVYIIAPSSKPRTSFCLCLRRVRQKSSLSGRFRTAGILVLYRFGGM